MLYLPAQKLADFFGVSHLTVNRWIQSGWLKGVDIEGRRGAAIWVSAREVLVEFESIPRLIEARNLDLNLEELRAFVVVRDP